MHHHVICADNPSLSLPNDQQIEMHHLFCLLMVLERVLLRRSWCELLWLCLYLDVFLPTHFQGWLLNKEIKWRAKRLCWEGRAGRKGGGARGSKPISWAASYDIATAVSFWGLGGDRLGRIWPSPEKKHKQIIAALSTLFRFPLFVLGKQTVQSSSRIALCGNHGRFTPAGSLWAILKHVEDVVLLCIW